MRALTVILIVTLALLAAYPAYQNFRTDEEQVAQTATTTQMPAEERTAFRQEVRAYLLENPEVLMEAISVLEQRQQQAQVQSDLDLVASNSDEIFDDGYSWVGGNPDGDITLVEFRDYRCGYCRKAHSEIKELVESDGNIRLVIKEFPILGEQSTISSQIAIATFQSAGPEKYREVGDFLMTFNGNLTPKTIAGILERFGVDAEPVLAEMTGGGVDVDIARTRQLAEQLKISGTPTFVLGGEMLRGYVPLETMRSLVDQARAKSG